MLFTMPSAETFWGTIIGTMVVVGAIVFIILFKENSKYIEASPVSNIWGVFIASLMAGVVGGGILGLIIFALMQAGRR